MKTHKFVAGLLAAGAALAITAGPAAAAPAPQIPAIPPQLLDTLFGSLSGQVPGPPPAPGKPQTTPGRPSPNGVASIAVTVSNYNGKKLGPGLYSNYFSPRVTWSSRDRANAEVRGNDCQIEVQFPGTSIPTYKTADCTDYENFSTRYSTPGRYSIVVVDRVSGASSTSPFTIE